MLEFLNICENFTLVLTKTTRHRTPSTEKHEGAGAVEDAVVNPCTFSYAQPWLSKDEAAV